MSKERSDFLTIRLKPDAGAVTICEGPYSRRFEPGAEVEVSAGEWHQFLASSGCFELVAPQPKPKSKVKE